MFGPINPPDDCLVDDPACTIEDLCPVCADPPACVPCATGRMEDCPQHGIAAFNAHQSEFYRNNPR